MIISTRLLYEMHILGMCLLFVSYCWMTDYRLFEEILIIRDLEFLNLDVHLLMGILL